MGHGVTKDNHVLLGRHICLVPLSFLLCLEIETRPRKLDDSANCGHVCFIEILLPPAPGHSFGVFILKKDFFLESFRILFFFRDPLTTVLSFSIMDSRFPIERDVLVCSFVSYRQVVCFFLFYIFLLYKVFILWK